MALPRVLVAALLLASCVLSAAAPATVVSQKTYVQTIKRVFFGDTSSGACAVSGSNYLDIDLGPGSGAFIIGNNMWTISDRGANIDCQGKDAPGGPSGLTTLSKACQATGCPAGNKIYPVPDFSPTIQRWLVSDVFASGTTPTPVDTITVKKTNKQGITGFPNFQQGDTSSGNPFSNLLTGETPYGPDFKQLPNDPFGQDTEAIVVVSANADGTGATFWISEEFGPSVSKLGSDGTVLARHVPAGVVYDTYVARAKNQLTADPTNGYPIYPTFPSILVKRELNRGFENLATFGKYLYAILQSPMANPGEAIQAISRVVRLFKLELNDAFPGGAKVVGEYVYFTEDVKTFPQDQPKADQSNQKLGDAVAIAEDVILVDEHVTLQTNLYRIELAGATNILGTKWDDVLQTPTLEQLNVAGPFGSSDTLAAEGIIPVKKTLAFDSFADLPASGPQLPIKIEAVGVYGNPNDAANPAKLVIINDNDFGIAGEITEFTEIAVAPSAFGASVAPATATATPTPTPTSTNGCISVSPKGGTCDYQSSTPNQCYNSDGSAYTCCGASSCGSPPGTVPFCAGQTPGTTPLCSAPTGTPAATTGAPAATTGSPAATTGAPGPTAFAAGGTCNAGSSLPNQCFNANGSKYVCCAGACGSPPGDLPFCKSN